MTFKRPAYEQVTIAHGGHTVTLRPSLQAACTLEARYSLPALYEALQEHNFTIIKDIILMTSSSGYGIFPNSISTQIIDDIHDNLNWQISQSALFKNNS